MCDTGPLVLVFLLSYTDEFNLLSITLFNNFLCIFSYKLSTKVLSTRENDNEMSYNTPDPSTNKYPTPIQECLFAMKICFFHFAIGVLFVCKCFISLNVKIRAGCLFVVTITMPSSL